MSFKDTCFSVWEALPVTINSGSSLTDMINLAGLRLFAIVLPSDWTPANLTFQMSPDAGTTWANLNDSNGTEIVAVAETSCCILMDPAPLSSLQYLRVRSGSSAEPIAQSAARQLKLIIRGI